MSHEMEYSMKRTPPTGRQRRGAAAVALTATAALLLGACTSTGETPDTSNTSDGATDAPAGDINPDGIIEAGISYALGGSFDPMLASGAVNLAANWHTMEGLTDLDPVTREVYAALGAELPTKVDETTFEVDLRDGA